MLLAISKTWTIGSWSWRDILLEYRVILQMLLTSVGQYVNYNKLEIETKWLYMKLKSF
jgi:hypothetical protein